METEPLREYGRPQYPTRREAAVEMDWLKAHWPAAWRHLAGLGGAAALFLSGCGGESAAPPADTPPPGSRPAAAPESRGSADQLERPGIAAVVAPIFEHGVGRGATGCVVISPPVFMSEEEALQIIREELGKAGLAVTEAGVELADVKVDGRDNSAMKTAVARKLEEVRAELDAQAEPAEILRLASQRSVLLAKRRELDSQASPVQIDLADPTRHVAVEFVSSVQCEELGESTGTGYEVKECDRSVTFSSWWSSVSSYDTITAARTLLEKLQKGGHGAYFGVFYDPAGHVDENRIKAEAEKLGGEREAWRQARQAVLSEKVAQNRELLRQQVRDFAKWLAEKGVIAAPASRPAEEDEPAG